MIKVINILSNPSKVGCDVCNNPMKAGYVVIDNDRLYDLCCYKKFAKINRNIEETEKLLEPYTKYMIVEALER